MSHEPGAVKFETKEEYTGRKLRVGIIGAGGIANVHLDAYAQVPQVEVVAICDIDENHLALTAAAHGIKNTYNSMEEMIAAESLDAADVCVWNCNHAKCSIYALEHGLNVLCEKPMAMNAAEAEAMRSAAEKAGKVLMLGFVLRFSAENDLITDFRDDIGDIYYAKATYLRRHGAPGGWFCDKARSGGGPVIDLGVHVIDQTRFLMGSPKPVSVFASTSYKVGFRPELKNQIGWSPVKNKFDNGIADVEDFGTALIRYDNGAVVHLEASYSLNGESRNEKVLYGKNGGIVLSDAGIKLYTQMHNRLVDITPVPTGETQNMFVDEMAHFASCCLDGVPCRATAEDGIWVMKILDAIYESARTGHEAEIK